MGDVVGYRLFHSPFYDRIIYRHTVLLQIGTGPGKAIWPRTSVYNIAMLRTLPASSERCQDHSAPVCPNEAGTYPDWRGPDATLDEADAHACVECGKPTATPRAKRCPTCAEARLPSV